MTWVFCLCLQCSALTANIYLQIHGMCMQGSMERQSSVSAEQADEVLFTATGQFIGRIPNNNSKSKRITGKNNKWILQLNYVKTQDHHDSHDDIIVLAQIFPSLPIWTIFPKPLSVLKITSMTDKEKHTVSKIQIITQATKLNSLKMVKWFRSFSIKKKKKTQSRATVLQAIHFHASF